MTSAGRVFKDIGAQGRLAVLSDVTFSAGAVCLEDDILARKVWVGIAPYCVLEK